MLIDEVVPCSSWLNFLAALANSKLVLKARVGSSQFSILFYFILNYYIKI